MNARIAPVDHAEDAEEPWVEYTHIDGSLSDDFVLAKPVRVEIWIESGEFVADAPELNVHAFGDTREEALRNVRVQLVEQRQRFTAHGDRLSDMMRDVARKLEAIVVPRHD